MSKVNSFSEIVSYVNEQGKDIEVLIPVADSGSALGGVSAFIDAVDISVKVKLVGDKEKIAGVISEKGLEENLRSNNVEIIPAVSMEECFNTVLDSIDRKKNQIILKGNSTSDQLMKGLLQQKEKIIDAGNIISHMRLFEMSSGMVLMSDGGINVVSNVLDDEKRKKLIDKIRGNVQNLGSMFGMNSKDLFVPGDAGNIEELRKTAATRFADVCVFPHIMQFPWIGPANIIYKASASTPWDSVYIKDLELPVTGSASLFRRTDTGAEFVIAYPEKGADFTSKNVLMGAVLQEARTLGMTEPKAAILDFTEQYETFMNTPSIADSRKLVEAFSDGRGVVEGPMAFDLAASEKAARIKKFDSAVSGKADILFMPDFTAGVLLTELYRNWKYLRLPWPGADISFGGPVPILVPSRSDTPEHKLRSVIAAAFITLHID